MGKLGPTVECHICRLNGQHHIHVHGVFVMLVCLFGLFMVTSATILSWLLQTGKAWSADISTEVINDIFSFLKTISSKNFQCSSVLSLSTVTVIVACVSCGVVKWVECNPLGNPGCASTLLIRKVGRTSGEIEAELNCLGETIQMRLVLKGFSKYL